MSINLRYITILLCSLLALCGCSDDLVPNPGGTPSRGLTVYVPAAGSFDSRSEASAPELTYTSLTFFAFPEDGDPVAVRLPVGDDPADNVLPVVDTYRGYTIDLPQGKYHFYLVANVFADSDPLPSDLTDLTEAIFTLPVGFDASLPASGLPMSADHTDFSVVSSSGAVTSLTSAAYNYNGDGGEIRADLTFLYAKVTVKATDASGDPAPLSDIALASLSQREPLFPAAAFTDYGTITSLEADDATGSLTFYIPERYVASSAAATQSSLSLSIGDTDILLPLGETADASTEQVNTLPAPDSHRSIVRGTHYKYTLGTFDRFNLEVAPWTPQSVAAELKGPVYLHIEQQVYEVQTGVETPIWFESNTTLTLDSPKYDGMDLYDYKINANADTIFVFISDDIPSSAYAEIMQSIADGEGKYDFFHLVAGPISKRITVNPVNLDYFLIVNPEVVPIDVRLRVASGEYTGSIPVSIHTNYPKVKITRVEGWDEIPAGESDALTLSDINHTHSILSEDFDVSEGMTYCLINFSGLNSGYTFWRSDQTLTFIVDGLDDSGSVRETATVTINVIPSMLNYKIHFRAKNGDWALPHIYVYQCLEFPADYTETYQGRSLASQPIGYNDNGAGYNKFAALEYSFTGAIAFLGWDSEYNYSILYNSDGSPKPFVGSRQQGFYIFNNYGYADWDAKGDQAFKHYNFNMDFCSEHRSKVVTENPAFPGKYCPYCAGDNASMNRLWSGIMMKPEGNGWYEFELTGIASTGKALIMFADNHFGSGSTHVVAHQFPGSGQVGIPLFDFPSREGWLEYNGNIQDRVGNQFTSTAPSSYLDIKPVKAGVYPCRIYWGDTNRFIHLWATGSGLTHNGVSQEDYTQWGQPASWGKESGSYRYFDFNLTVYQTGSVEIHGITSPGSGQTNYKVWSFRDFKLQPDGTYCAYIKDVYDPNSDLVPGIPAGAN